MATNPPKGGEICECAVRERSRVESPTTRRSTDRDAEMGRLIDQEADDKPFKGARKEK